MRIISTQQLLVFSTLFLLSCSEPTKVTEYIDGKQLLNMNELSAYGQKIKPVELIVLKPDSVKIGKQAVFKIVTSDPKYKLVNGIFDCELTERSVIDTSTYKIDSCIKGYIVQDDTLYIAFKPQQVGRKKFEESIIGISQDSDRVLRYHLGAFDYEVTE